jgi:RimJ/RimL family protein N-acetyltransferase
VLIAALPPAPVTVVSTGRDNQPAGALYQRLGFRHLGDVQVIPGLWVSRFRRNSPPWFRVEYLAKRLPP